MRANQATIQSHKYIGGPIRANDVFHTQCAYRLLYMLSLFCYSKPTTTLETFFGRNCKYTEERMALYFPTN